MRIYKGLLATLLLGNVSLSALTLKESISESIETNPTIKERLHNYRATVQELEMAQGEYLPTLDLVSSIGKEKTSDDNSKFADQTSLNYYENSLVLLYNIFNGFSTTNKVDYQKSRAMAASYHLIEKSNDVAFNMTNSYIQVLKNQELLQVAKEQIVLTKEILDKITPLEAAGLAETSELFKIKSSFSLAQSNLVVQQNNTIDALSKFSSILGRRISISELTKPTFISSIPKTMNEAIEYAITNNPSLVTTNYNIKAAKSLLLERQKDLYPKLDLRVEQNLDNNINGLEENRNRFRAGFVLSYNLFRGGIDSATKIKHKSMLHQDIQKREILKKDVIEGLELSWAAYTLLKNQLTYLYEYEESSLKVMTLYKDEYDIGTRTLLDLLSAQDAYIASKNQIIKAEYEHLFAKYRIVDSMGILVPTVLGNGYNSMKNIGLTDDIVDTTPVLFDQDNDGVVDSQDICSNSKIQNSILGNGCNDFKNKYSKIIHFKSLKFDSISIDSDSIENFNKIKETIKNNKKNIIKVVISGFSESNNNQKGNLEISKDIAQNIKEQLKFTGISQSKLIIKTNSNNNPISTNDEINQRVEVVMFLNKDIK